MKHDTDAQDAGKRLADRENRAAVLAAVHSEHVCRPVVHGDRCCCTSRRTCPISNCQQARGDKIRYDKQNNSDWCILFNYWFIMNNVEKTRGTEKKRWKEKGIKPKFSLFLFRALLNYDNFISKWIKQRITRHNSTCWNHITIFQGLLILSQGFYHFIRRSGSDYGFNRHRKVAYCLMRS